MRRTRGSETSQYPEEEKSNEIPLVAASEGGIAQTDPNTKSSASKLTGYQAYKLNHLKIQGCLLASCQAYWLVSQRLCVRVGLGSSPFARRYLENLF